MMSLCMIINSMLVGCADSDISTPPSMDQMNMNITSNAMLDQGTIADFTITAMSSEEEFQLCTQHMYELLEASYQQHCHQYSEIERQDPASDYATQFVVAACLALQCEQRVIEGHNGVMIAKSCKDLDDLKEVLVGAVDQALGEDMCMLPSYQTRILDHSNFMGGERCDQWQCSVSLDGVVVETQQP